MTKINSPDASETKRRTILDVLIKMVDLDIYHAGNSEYDPSVANDPFEYDPTYKDKIKAVKECLAAANALPAYIKEKYNRLLKIKDKRELSQWIYNDKDIMKALDKTSFEDVYCYIARHTLSLKDTINLAQELSIEKYKTSVKSGKDAGKPVERTYCLFIPDYPDMVNELKLSKISIQKYLQKFCEIGILLKLRKKDSRGNNIYAVGYWSPYIQKQDKEERIQRIWFLKETPEIKEALRDFKIRG
jgi:hypothetical protein